MAAGKGERTKVPAECEKLHRALTDCHRREPSNGTVGCPEESDAVRNLCVSGGTSLKRSQCQQAQLSLSIQLVALVCCKIKLHLMQQAMDTQ